MTDSATSLYRRVEKARREAERQSLRALQLRQRLLLQRGASMQACVRDFHGGGPS